MHVQQLQKVDAILIGQEQLLSQPLQNASRSHTSGRIQPNSTPDPRDTYEIEDDVIASSDRTTLVKRRTPAYRSQERDRLRFRTPTWLMSRVWEVRVKEACSGWMLGLSSYHIRARDALVFKYARDGDIQNLQQLFDEKKASPFDRNLDGKTLLHVRHSWDTSSELGVTNVRSSLFREGSLKFVASYWSKALIAKYQILTTSMTESCKCNFSADSTSTPLRRLLHPANIQSLEMYRLLIQEADTDELTDADSVLELLVWSRSGMPPEAMKLLQQEMCCSWGELDLESRIRLSTWADNADLARLLLGPGPLQKEHFQVKPLGISGTWLFSHIANRLGRICRSKHKDASWQALLREAIALNAHLLICEQCESPLAAFLEGLKLNHTQIGPSRQPQLYWLQSMQRAGADLVEYGRFEKSLLNGPHLRWTTFSGYGDSLVIREVYIVNITYGPEPEDWHVWYAWTLDEWAGEFWHMVENPELFDIPGAWLPE